MAKLVKICGVKDAGAVEAAAEAGADYVGLNFFERSPRFVTPAVAAELAARAKGGPKLVGLFVDPKPGEVEAMLGKVKLDFLQIYGAPRRYGLPVWRSLGVGSETDFPAADEDVAGYVVEAKPPAGATRPGGNAVVADWALLARWRTAKFWLLAGGLTAGNVVEALRVTGAAGADVSSGVETAPGVKDPELIKAFIRKVKKEVLF